MKFIKKSLLILKNKFSGMKTSLTHINDSEPLSKLSLVVIIFLDIFILITLFQGLADHTSQLTTPADYIPETCREIFIQQNWTEPERISNLGSIITSDDSSSSDKKHGTEDIHPTCRTCISTINRIKKDEEIRNLFKKRNQLFGFLSNIQDDIESLKTSYDTWLLEKISGNSSNHDTNDIKAIKRSLSIKRKKVNSIINQIAAIDRVINKNAEIVVLFKNISNIKKDSSDNLKNDLEALNFWFPAKKLLMQLIFLLPLFIIFYFWASRSQKKKAGLQTLISSHLLIVTFIPVFLKISEAVYKIIPKKVLKMLWDFLVSIKLVAVWHYFIILISIGLSLLMIYIIQKRIFSREKLIERRITKGLCIDCGKKIPFGSKACSICGFKQYTQCPACGEETFIHGQFCKNCGTSQSEE